MKTEKRVFSALLVLLLIASLAASVPAAWAEEHSNTSINRYNVMLVVDKSGSLWENGNGSDPKGLRFDAMKLFLGLLTESGNNVGTVVFDETIKYDSGMLGMKSMRDKKNLIEEIEAQGTSYDTDIGSAMLRAAQELAQMQDENGLPGIILLLTDGKTELPGSRLEDSRRAAGEALELAQASGITVHGVLLNVNGKGAGGEKEVRAFTDGTDGEFEEVTRPEDLTDTFKRFYSIINQTEYTGAEKVLFSETGEAETSFVVPRFGLEEVNIVIEHASVGDGNLGDKMDITVVQPDGNRYNITSHDMQTSRYILVKIPHPMTGKWNVRLKGDPNDTVDISLIYNASMTITLTGENPDDTYMVNRPYRFVASVMDTSIPDITDDDLRSMNAVLSIKEAFSGEVREFPLEAKNGVYICDASFRDGGSYTISAKVGLAGFEVRSNTLTVRSIVPSIVAKADSVTDMLTEGTFRGEYWEKDITLLFEDPKQTELKYAVSDDQGGALTIENGLLRLRCPGLEKASFLLRATDAYDLSAEIPFDLVLPVPEAYSDGIAAEVKTGLFQEGSWEMQIDGLFADPKGTAMQYAVSDDFNGAVRLADGVLHADCLGLGGASFAVTATDAYGLRAEIPVELTEKNMTPPIVLTFSAVVLLLVLLIAFLMYQRSRLLCKMQITIQAFQDDSYTELMPLYNFRGSRSLKKLGTIYGAKAGDYSFVATKDPHTCLFKGKKPFYVDDSERKVKSARILAGMSTTIILDQNTQSGLNITTFDMSV